MDWLNELNDMADLMQNETMVKYACRNLPCRRPRGSVENVIRAFMFPLLLKGMTRDHAEITALERAADLGLNIDQLQLVY